MNTGIVFRKKMFSVFVPKHRKMARKTAHCYYRFSYCSFKTPLDSLQWRVVYFASKYFGCWITPRTSGLIQQKYIQTMRFFLSAFRTYSGLTLYNDQGGCPWSSIRVPNAMCDVYKLISINYGILIVRRYRKVCFLLNTIRISLFQADKHGFILCS